MDSVWVRFGPLAGYGTHGTGYGTQGTPVRYTGYIGTTFEVQQGKWVHCPRYACCLGTVCKVHGYGTQGTSVQHSRYNKASGCSVQGTHVVWVRYARYIGTCSGMEFKV